MLVLLFPNASHLELAGWEPEGSLSHKAACLQPAGVWEETGTRCTEEKGGSQSIIPFSGKGLVMLWFLSRTICVCTREG